MTERVTDCSLSSDIVFEIANASSRSVKLEPNLLGEKRLCKVTPINPLSFLKYRNSQEFTNYDYIHCKPNV